MSDETYDGKPPQRRDDGNDQPKRDDRGRWLPGYCPNPEGRPKKPQPKIVLYDSDFYEFANSLVDITISGEQVRMPRRAVMHNKLFEQALKGKTQAIRMFFKEIKEIDMRHAEARVRYDQLITDWHLNNKGPDRKEVPFEIEQEIAALRAVLNHYYPGSY